MLAGDLLLILATVVIMLPSADTLGALSEAKTVIRESVIEESGIRKSVIEEPLPAIAVTPAVQPTAPPVTIQREVVYVQGLSTNVRDAPSTTAKVVGTQPPGTRLTVFQRQGGWVEVGQEEPIGWIGLRMVASSPPTQAAKPRRGRQRRSDASDDPATSYVGPQGRVTFGVPFSFDGTD